VIRDAIHALVLAGAAAAAMALAEPPASGALTAGAGGSTGASTTPPEARVRPAPRPVELPRGDPFRPFDQPAPAAGAVQAAGPQVRTKLRFYGTFEKGKLRVAQINDQFVKVGDKIDGATVREIEARRVVLERGGILEVLTDEES